MFQEQGEKLARDILRQQLDLEDTGVIFWARNDYEQIGADLDAADNMYRNQQFDSALDQYKAVLASLAKLKSRTPGELEKHTRFQVTKHCLKAMPKPHLPHSRSPPQ